MGSDDRFLKRKVRVKLNNTFCRIVNDIPSLGSQGQIVVIRKGEIITCDQFYNILLRCVIEYIPHNGENFLIKAITKLPRLISNIKEIKQNHEIIILQESILNKYFYLPGNDNIKEKIVELKKEIDFLIADEPDLFVDVVDRILDNFEARMKDGIVKDIKNLYSLINQ